MLNKKILIISGLVLGVIVISFAVYAIFSKDKELTEPVSSEQQIGVGGSLPGIGDSGDRQILDDDASTDLPLGSRISESLEEDLSIIASGGKTLVEDITEYNVAGFKLSSSGKNLSLYNKKDNKFYRLSSDGITKTALSDKEFYNVEKVVWNNNGDRAILEYPDGSNIIYDFKNDKQYSLPKEAQDFSFSGSGNNIAFQYISEDYDNRWLMTADSNGSGLKFVEPVGDKQNDVQVNWSPNNQVVAWYRKGNGYDTQEIYFIGQNGENFKTLEVNGRGFQGKWTPDGKKVLYSVYNEDSNYNPSLWIAGGQGEAIGSNNKSLNIQTWPDKCVFAGTNDLYCAVPASLPEGAGLYPEIANDVSDNLYKINLKTGFRTLIAEPQDERGLQYSVEQITVSPDEDYIYFTDKLLGQVHRIRLE